MATTRPQATMQMVLTSEEQKTLVEVLSEALPNLREEIYKTESYQLRGELKRREAIVKNLLSRLGASLASPS